VQACGAPHHQDYHPDERERGHLPVGEGVTDGAHRHPGGVLAVGPFHPERRGDLLQEDDHRDAERETLDDRPRDVCEVAAQSQGGRHDEHGTGDQGHDGHGAHPVAGHDGKQHHRHRARRPAHLDVGTAEHRGHEAATMAVMSPPRR